MGDSPPRKLRLNVVSPVPTGSPEASALASEMAAAVAQFEASMASDPGRPVALEETGLSAAELDALEREGVSLPRLRAIGRDLRERGQARTIDAYRRILADDA